MVFIPLNESRIKSLSITVNRLFFFFFNYSISANTTCIIIFPERISTEIAESSNVVSTEKYKVRKVQVEKDLIRNRVLPTKLTLPLNN